MTQSVINGRSAAVAGLFKWYLSTTLWVWCSTLLTSLSDSWTFYYVQKRRLLFVIGCCDVKCSQLHREIQLGLLIVCTANIDGASSTNCSLGWRWKNGCAVLYIVLAVYCYDLSLCAKMKRVTDCSHHKSRITLPSFMIGCNLQPHKLGHFTAHDPLHCAQFRRY